MIEVLDNITGRADFCLQLLHFPIFIVVEKKLIL